MVAGKKTSLICDKCGGDLTVVLAGECPAKSRAQCGIERILDAELEAARKMAAPPKMKTPKIKRTRKAKKNYPRTAHQIAKQMNLFSPLK